jgi:tetratricopeptide (TPR) repeat protein
MYWWEGEYDKAIEQAQNALEFNPDYPVALFVLGNAYADKGMFEQAIEAHKRAAAVNPRRKWALGITYGKAGQTEEALAIAAELESEGSIKATWRLSLIYAAIGDRDKTFYWLNQAYERGANYIQWFIRDGNFDWLKDDPRYKDLAKRMNLPIESFANHSRNEALFTDGSDYIYFQWGIYKKFYSLPSWVSS